MTTIELQAYQSCYTTGTILTRDYIDCFRSISSESTSKKDILQSISDYDAYEKSKQAKQFTVADSSDVSQT